MQNPERDSEPEKAIQDLIAKGSFDEACTQACIAYRGELLRFCGRMLGGISHSRPDGEDIVQEVFTVFLRVLRKGRYKSEATVRPFLYGITRVLLANYYRRMKRSPALLRLDDFMHVVGLRDIYTESRALDREQLNRVLQELNKGPLIDRQIFILRYLQHLSIADIAIVVARTEGTVRTRHSRLRQRLREAFNRDN